MFLNQKMTLKLLKPHIMRYHNIENCMFFHMTPKSGQDDFLYSCYALFCGNNDIFILRYHGNGSGARTHH